MSESDLGRSSRRAPNLWPLRNGRIAKANDQTAGTVYLFTDETNCDLGQVRSPPGSTRLSSSRRRLQTESGVRPILVATVRSKGRLAGRLRPLRAQTDQTCSGRSRCRCPAPGVSIELLPLDAPAEVRQSRPPPLGVRPLLYLSDCGWPEPSVQAAVRARRPCRTTSPTAQAPRAAKVFEGSSFRPALLRAISRTCPEADVRRCLRSAHRAADGGSRTRPVQPTCVV